MTNKPEKSPENDSGYVWIFCKEYTNRWGQLMVAEKYGYQFWRFRIKRRC